MCHKHENGFMPVGGGACNACHGAPPETGAHRAHFGGTAEQASYGTVQNLSTDDTYIFSCGTCHPSSSSSFHQNGHVDIELRDANAPSGSLKSLNPPSAAYDSNTRTCSNVYCHSATTWSSGPVGSPITGVNEFPILDARGNLTYAPYELGITRNYAMVNWEGTDLDCNGCHRNGPQTTYPTVQAGVGNSHGWVDDYGYEDLHAYNMASDPLTCRVCHYGEVTAEQTWSRNTWDITTYDNVALNNKSVHVNGQKDVAFDPVNPAYVRDEPFSLAGALYDRDSRTCSGVPCHLSQSTPEWGKPYRWWEEAECDQCHNYSGWFGQGARLGNNHPEINGQSCTRCHEGHPHG
jgi:predicted CxxxxCH...CXXCH cytochrome family protein